uniref:Uncharacterized protein n=1 Tax=Rhizophora mucronata TaxID=61149 RepID=A0A2P2PQI9_RHIMU
MNLHIRVATIVRHLKSLFSKCNSNSSHMVLICQELCFNDLVS